MRHLFALAAGCILAAQPMEHLRSANASPVEISGIIKKVSVEPRRGSLLVVKVNSGVEWSVWLGSFRYLLEHDFNPKAGQQVIVRGTVCEKSGMIAQSITVTQTGRTFEPRLRRHGPGMCAVGPIKTNRPRP